MSDEDSEKYVAFELELDSEESPRKTRAKKRKGENQEARKRKKKRVRKDFTMILQILEEQKEETAKISKGFVELASEVDSMKAAREVKTSAVQTRKTRSKQIKEDSESDDNEVKKKIKAVVNKKSVDENKKN